MNIEKKMLYELKEFDKNDIRFARNITKLLFGNEVKANINMDVPLVSFINNSKYNILVRWQLKRALKFLLRAFSDKAEICLSDLSFKQLVMIISKISSEIKTSDASWEEVSIEKLCKSLFSQQYNEKTFKFLNKDHSGIYIYFGYFPLIAIFKKGALYISIWILFISKRKEFSYKYLSKRIFLMNTEAQDLFLKALLNIIENSCPLKIPMGLIRQQDTFYWDDDHWTSAMEANISLERDYSKQIMPCPQLVNDLTVGALSRAVEYEK